MEDDESKRLRKVEMALATHIAGCDEHKEYQNKTLEEIKGGMKELKQGLPAPRDPEPTTGWGLASRMITKYGLASVIAIACLIYMFVNHSKQAEKIDQVLKAIKKAE